jgi:hypothetical protein
MVPPEYRTEIERYRYTNLLDLAEGVMVHKRLENSG